MLRERRRQCLDGDCAAQFAAVRPIFLAHAADAQQREGAIRPELPAQRRFRARHGDGRVLNGGFSRKLPGCSSLAEQLDLLAQFGLSAASLVEICLPLLQRSKAA